MFMRNLACLTLEDLKLINQLSSRKYTGFSFSSNSTQIEKDQFDAIKNKLKNLAIFFSNKYTSDYGPFHTNVSPEANPITRGNSLNYVWSTFFKGNRNKQYSAQISFVIDKVAPFLYVGFYFGSASSHSLKETERENLEAGLTNLGIKLSNAFTSNYILRDRYNDLFDLGFSTYIGSLEISPESWIARIKKENKNASLTVKVYPNNSGIIEISTLDFFVSQVLFLMTPLVNNNGDILRNPQIIPPLTPEQWAKQAERKAQIGYKGEVFIFDNEVKRLQKTGIQKKGYPRHVALESSHYGYDILSLDELGNELFIEVKSTTRHKEDPNSRKFFISKNEYETYCTHKVNYKLYRVYDVENQPEYEIFDLDKLNINPNSYEVEY